MCIYLRSSPTFSLDCSSGQREQLNLATSFIDASQVYGSRKSVSDSLRTFTGGQLRTTNGIIEGKAYLPKSKDTCSATKASKNLKCFKSGDPRTSENLGLSGIHINLT